MPRLSAPKTTLHSDLTDVSTPHVNADIAAAAAIAYSKLATDPRICRIKTGTYTGDGTISQAITGIGFQPKVVFIFSKDASIASYVSNDAMDTGGAQRIDINTYNTNAIISLDSDGFTVDDAGGDADPNKVGRNYTYIAFG